MRSTTTNRRWIVLTALVMLLFSCSSTQPKRAQIEGAIRASANINPDLSGSYRPVNVKLFFLNNDTTFRRSGFNQLYSNSEEILGDELIFTLNKQVLPGQTILLEESIPDGTKYVGVIAAFRALEESEWRDIKPLPECWTCRNVGRPNSVNVNLDKLNVEVSLND